jgi:hypothetical protein
MGFAFAPNAVGTDKAVTLVETLRTRIRPVQDLTHCGVSSLTSRRTLLFVSGKNLAMNFWPELDRHVPEHLITQTDAHATQG